MKTIYRQIAATSASVPFVGGRAGLRGYGVLAATAALPSTPTCQCGNARYVSSRARASPTVRRAARQQNLKRRVPIEQQQQQQPPQASGRASAAGGPMSGSIFPDDLSILLPALETATEMTGETLTEDEFLHVIASASKIIEGRRPVLEAELLSDYNTTPYQLHMAAVLLLYGHKAVPETIPSLFIALSLMHLATASIREPGGYLPSTLTIVNMIAAQWPQSPAKSDALRKTSIYRNAERQFLAYLTKQNSGAATPLPTDESSEEGGPDAAADALSLQADAFTLAGVLAESAGEPDRALQWYLAAREVGNASFGESEAGEANEQPQQQEQKEDTEPRDVRWSWEQRCLEGIGRLHLASMKQQAGTDSTAHTQQQTDQYKEAKTALRTAALALGSGHAGLWLATDYATEDDTGDDLDMMLYRAAVHAVPGAYDALVRREATKAAVLRGLNSSKVTEDAVFHQMVADEWQKLADVSKAASKAA